MNKKKILISVVLVVALGIAAYLMVGHFTTTKVPQLETGVGVWESEIHIVGNPGGFEIAIVTFLNGKDEDRIFYVTLQPPNPDKLPTGYEALPQEYYDWFTMPEEGIPVQAGGYCRVPIPISVPYDTDYLDRNAVVKVQGIGFDPEGGFAQIGVASIWYIVIVETEED